MEIGRDRSGDRGDATCRCHAVGRSVGVVQPLGSLLQENKSRHDPEEGRPGGGEVGFCRRPAEKLAPKVKLRDVVARFEEVGLAYEHPSRGGRVTGGGLKGDVPSRGINGPAESTRSE